MSQHSWLQNFSRSLTFQIINHEMIYNNMIISLLYYLTWNARDIPYWYCGSIRCDTILEFRECFYQNMLQNRGNLVCTFIAEYNAIKYKFRYMISQFPWSLKFAILSENDMNYHPSIFVTNFFFFRKNDNMSFPQNLGSTKVFRELFMNYSLE